MPFIEAAPERAIVGDASPSTFAFTWTGSEARFYTAPCASPRLRMLPVCRLSVECVSIPRLQRCVRSASAAAASKHGAARIAHPTTARVPLSPFPL